MHFVACVADVTACPFVHTVQGSRISPVTLFEEARANVYQHSNVRQIKSCGDRGGSYLFSGSCIVGVFCPAKNENGRSIVPDGRRFVGSHHPLPSQS